ncbi:MAG TPA: response regulator [Candidatus Binatia bacterium]|jgi:CheY-like chemotaxis protein
MRKRVLLVEDHPDTSDIIQRELSVVGYDVLIAEDGHQAVAFAAHLLPDVIVMDMKLPKLSGHEATMRIRENSKTASIPILAATALTGPGEREKCLAAGCNDYLAKPFTYRELDQAIRKLLQQANASKENVSEPVATKTGSGSERR